MEFAVLPLVFLLATFAVGAQDRRLRAAVREQKLPLGLFILAFLAVALVGMRRTLGYYHGALDLRPHAFTMLQWVGLDAMALAYASGWIIVPGALIGLWLALKRPRGRSERAFAWIPCCSRSPCSPRPRCCRTVASQPS